MSTALPAAGTGVPAYVAAVRARLSDLTADELEELTGGLEADLAEASAGGSPWERFGDPADYADELRSAAGLPPRPPGGERAGATARLRLLAREAARRREYAIARDVLVDLRPAWWVLRAVAALGLVGWFLIRDRWRAFEEFGLVGTLVLLPLLLAVSVLLGRRPPQVFAARALVAAGNVLAAVVLPLVLAPLWTDPPGRWETATEPTGVQNDGGEVYNIFPYDAQGRPLADVRLYDDRGRPLSAGVDLTTYIDAAGRMWELEPRQGILSGQWNSYPLQRRLVADPARGGGLDRQPPEDPPRPFPSLRPLAVDPTPAPAPTTAPTAAPTAVPAPTP